MAVGGFFKKAFGLDETSPIKSKSAPSSATNSPRASLDLGDSRRPSLFKRTSKADKGIGPLKEPVTPPTIRNELAKNDVIWLKPPMVRFPGHWSPLHEGVWSVFTNRNTAELCMTTHFPLYFSLGPTSPRMCGEMRTTYFEVHIIRLGPKVAADDQKEDSEKEMGKEEGYFSPKRSPTQETRPQSSGLMTPTLGGARKPDIAIGFVAKPYNPWRMPGRERGSFGIRCDDGRRYVNQSPQVLPGLQGHGEGHHFTRPIKERTIIGIGVRYWLHDGGAFKSSDAPAPPSSLDGEAFFTRNGHFDGSWPLHQPSGSGLAGDHDLCGAIGSIGEVEYKAVFRKSEFKFNLDSLPTPKAQLPALTEVDSRMSQF